MHHVSSSALTRSCSLHPGYLQVLPACLHGLGVDPERVYTPETLATLASLTEEMRQPLEAWEGMLRQAERVMALDQPDVDLALDLAEFVKPWDTGPLGFITMASRHLREATEALAHFYSVLNDVYLLHATLHDDHFELRMQPLGSRVSPDLERLTLATIAWHARWLSQHAELAFDVAFSGPPLEGARRARIERTFGGQLTYGAACSVMRGPAHYASLPISRGDHGVQAMLRAQLTERMHNLQSQSGSFLHLIERQILDRLESGTATLEAVAQAVGMPERTLQHRLEAGGLSFRVLHDRVRHQQAVLLIGEGRHTLAEIALKLGFSSQSSFHSAFKRWTGHTPGQTRRRQAVASATSHQSTLT